MSNVNLLSEKIQEKISELGWVSLTDIQEKTIPLVLNSKKHLIIESETASGKTEAVFLPLLSIMDNNKDYKNNVKILYISPLKALINDQFSRIYKLAEEMNIRITKWHGDVNSNIKKNFMINPSGILQITPESIEAFMINRPEKIRDVFGGIEYIVIDEIHSFVGKDRGYHLQSLLHRLNNYYNNKPRIFGLSATISGTDIIKKWVCNDVGNVELVKGELSNRKTYCNIMHFDKSKNSDAGVNPAMVNDILNLTKNKKVLIFCNSRAMVELLTYNLNDELGYKKFYAHHSYIDKKLREEIEQLIKEDEEISIVSTSTLELGIDIGSVDLVIQIDSTFSVSSLKQRIGRAGRRKNQDRISQIYTEEPESLLLSFSTLELMKQEKVESPIITKKNYDYLFQQILSIIVEKNGIRVEELIPEINNNPVFCELNNHEIILLLKSMISQNYILPMDSSSELILGYKGERLVHNKNFYSMFEATEPYDVIYDTKKIGFYDEFKNKGQVVALAGRSWIVISTIPESKKIYVEPYNMQGFPKFEPSNGEKSDIVRKEIFSLLNNQTIPKYINDIGINIIKEYQKGYTNKCLKNNQRIVKTIDNENCCEFFAEEKIINTIELYLLANNESRCRCDHTLGNIYYTDNFDINSLKNIKYSELINSEIELIIDKISISKYFKYLPKNLKKEIYIERYCDFKNLESFMKNLEIIDS